jgi:DNA-binding MarR family transcriptional regulator
MNGDAMEAVALGPIATDGVGARLVLVMLAGHWNARDGSARPGQRRLAALTGLAQSSVSRNLRRLVENGDLAVVERPRGTRPARYAVASLGSASESPKSASLSESPKADHYNGAGEALRSASDPLVKRPERIESRSRRNTYTREADSQVGPAQVTREASEILATLDEQARDAAAPAIVENALAQARRAAGLA